MSSGGSCVISVHGKEHEDPTSNWGKVITLLRHYSKEIETRHVGDIVNRNHTFNIPSNLICELSDEIFCILVLQLLLAFTLYNVLY